MRLVFANFSSRVPHLIDDTRSRRRPAASIYSIKCFSKMPGILSLQVSPFSYCEVKAGVFRTVLYLNPSKCTNLSKLIDQINNVFVVKLKFLQTIAVSKFLILFHLYHPCYPYDSTFKVLYLSLTLILLVNYA